MGAGWYPRRKHFPSDSSQRYMWMRIISVLIISCTRLEGIERRAVHLICMSPMCKFLYSLFRIVVIHRPRSAYDENFDVMIHWAAKSSSCFASAALAQGMDNRSPRIRREPYMHSSYVMRAHYIVPSRENRSPNGGRVQAPAPFFTGYDKVAFHELESTGLPGSGIWKGA